MNEREKQIAEAAANVYTRKGVRRATMSDIAKEAKVTRQTVYNTFANTDEVLRGAIRHYVDTQWQKIRQAWLECEDLDGKLEILLRHFAVEPWEFINSSEEAAELEHGYNAAGRAEVAASRLAFRDEVAAIFTPFERQLRKRGTSPHAVADFIGWAIEGVKHNCQDRETLLLSLSTLKAALLALTDDG